MPDSAPAGAGPGGNGAGKETLVCLACVAWLVATTVVHGATAAALAAGVVALVLAIHLGVACVLRDPVAAGCSTLLALMVLSLVPAAYARGATLACLALVAVVAFRQRERLRQQLASIRLALRSAGMPTLVTASGLAVAILFLGIDGPSGLYAADPFHPVYEASIGQSYAIRLFDAPDLSYAGKAIRFHPLSTQVPLLWMRLFDAPLLVAVYFLTPVANLAILLLILRGVAGKEGALRETPPYFLFLLPLIYVPGTLQNQLGASVLASNSYFAGFTLMLCLMHFLSVRRDAWTVLVLVLLLLVKASFFVTACGGVALFMLRTRDWRGILRILVPATLSFCVLYPLFLSNAHHQNHWLLLSPTPAYFGLLRPILDGTAGNLRGAGLVALSLAWTLATYVLVVRAYWHSRAGMAVAASIALAGILLMTVATEVTEANSFQFWIAANAAFAVVAWHALDGVRMAATARRVLVPAVVAVLLTAGAAKALQPVARNAERWASAAQPDLPRDLIEAYAWLGTQPPGTVLFGKHHEETTREPSWWPHTGFARSALSGHQMYVENYKHKGVAMDAAYPQRFVDSLLVSAATARPSEASARAMARFSAGDFGAQPGIPMSRRADAEGIAHYRLSLGKEWSWLNRPAQVAYEIRAGLTAVAGEAPAAALRGVLARSGASYIVLENGDAAREELLAVATLAHENASIKVFRIHPGGRTLQ
jgi:hypothetical protein